MKNQRSASSHLFGFALSLGLLIGTFPPLAQAAPITWANTGTDYNDGASWVGGVPPGTLDTGAFTGAAVTQPNVTANITNLSLSFTTAASSGYTLSNTGGAALTLTSTGSATTSGNSAITSLNNTSVNTISAPIVLGAAAAATQTFVQATGGTLAISGVISEANAGVKLNYLGTGTGSSFIISGANTYTGATTISQGSVSVANVGNSGSSSNLGTNGTINFGGPTTTTGTLIYTGAGETSDKVINLNGTSGGATITQSGTGNLLFTSNLTATGLGNKTLTLSGSTAGTSEISGSIVDSTGFVTNVTRAGTSGASGTTGVSTLSGNNSYSGLTTVSNTGGQSGTLIMSGTNSSAGQISVQGGILVLNNTTANNGGLASGLLTLSNGNLQATTAAPVAISNAVTLSTGSGGFSVGGSQSIVLNGDVTFTGQTGKGFDNIMTGGATLTLNGFLNLSNIGTNIYTSGPTSATGTTIINGVVRTLGVGTAGSITNLKGTLILANNANSYAGATTVSGGTLAGTVAHAFGDTTGISIAGGGILSLRGDSNTSFTKLAGGAYDITTTASNATINVTSATGVTTAKTMTAGNLALNTAITNNTNFTGSDNTSLSLGAVSTGTSVSGTETITNNIASTGTLTLASFTSNRTTAPTVAFAGTGNTFVTGAISETAGSPLALTKSGAGILTLNGANSYTGTTATTTGTLLVNGTHAGGGAYTVAAAGKLGGNGSITAASLSVSAGGKLTPGGDGVVGSAFTLALAGGMNLSASSNNTGAYIFDLASTAASDKITLTTGTLNLATLDFSDFAFNALAGFGPGIYTLFDASSAITGSIGTASGLIGGFTGTLSIDSTNNDVLLTVVPEPSTWAMLVGGLGMLIGFQRGRRRQSGSETFFKASA